MTIDYILMEVPNFVERKYGVLDTPVLITSVGKNFAAVRAALTFS